MTKQKPTYSLKLMNIIVPVGGFLEYLMKMHYDPSRDGPNHALYSINAVSRSIFLAAVHGAEVKLLAKGLESLFN